MALTIPQRRDPAARAALIAMAAGVIYLGFATVSTPAPTAQAQGDIIIVATPALPTSDPALGMAAPTMPPQLAPTAGPGWLDQQLANAAGAAAGFANDQAAALADEQAAAQAARDQYLANVGAQAQHSPRGDVSEPPPSQTGPILYPDRNAIVQPVGYDTPPPPAAPGMAVAVPPISAEQRAVLSQRDSNGCAPGQVFYPRTGCHTPGSGGPQPGAVGAP